MSRTFIVSNARHLPALVGYLKTEVEKGPVRVTVGARPSRTLEQNAYLHVAIRELAQHVGMTDSELKDVLKAEYGPPEIVRVGNLCTTVKKSVAKYSSAEASQMIEHVVRIAADCGLLLAPENDGGLL